MEVNYPNEGMPKLPPMKFGRWVVPVTIGIFAMSAVLSTIYQVNAEEQAVIQRFGKYVRTEGPGLHFKLPFGIETNRNVRVKKVFKQEFGFRTVQAGVRTIYAGRENPGRFNRQFRSGSDPFGEESLMLSGDLNVAIVQWIVQYKVKDPVKYLFKIRNLQETIRDMSEAVMRSVVGDRTINEVLTSGRQEIQNEAAVMLQELLDEYESGIDILNIILQDVTPPDPVKPSFNEVNEAKQEKEKLINQAWEEYNRVVPRAKGQAEQQVREAEGYALERINRAKGDAERFILTWESYKTAPEVTKRRLYLEMAQKVMPNLKDKIILDDSQKGILPLLSLNPEARRVES